MQTKNWETSEYLPLIRKVLARGKDRQTRAGLAHSIFGEMITIDTDTFPILKGRKMHVKPVLGELAAMLKGATTVKEFKELGCNYWDAWGDKEGNLALNYGTTWLDFNGVNQLEQVVKKLKETPNDRRIIISGWKPDDIPKLSLPCCHLLYQWYVRDNMYLDMIWYQRSVDLMVGLPSDVIFATVWNMLLAKTCGYKSGTIKMMLGDVHIYDNHIGGCNKYIEQLELIDPIESPEERTYADLANHVDVFNFQPDELTLSGYKHMPKVNFKLNV